MQSAPLDIALPEIGRYHLVAELARGGMGIVHLAATQGLGGFNKLLVVKELRPELAGDELYVRMFLDEARLAARLTHRNIVQTIEVGSESSRHYMVMEYLDGRSLHRIVRRFHQQRGGLPVGAHLRVIAEALLGLQYAHDLRDFDGEPLGIVHRDVSPLNVLVTFDGQAKLVDFGIAKSADSSQETKTGILKGRVAYMAPEQAWGSVVDRRADLYAVGVMIWEAAAGRRLWPGKSDVEILARLLKEEAPTLRDVRPEAPEDLTAICARAMAKRPEDRYASAGELLDDLETHLSRRRDAMTMREIGSLVTNAFSEERRRMSALVEEAVMRVRGGPRSGVVPTFEVHLRGTPSGKHLIGENEPSVVSRVATSAGAPAATAVTTNSHAPVGVSVPAEPQRPWWASRHVAVGAGAAVALLVLLLIVVATSFGDTPAHPEEPRPQRVLAARVIRKADMTEESPRDVGADTSRPSPPRVVFVPAPAPPPPTRTQKHDHVSSGPPSPPPPAETPAPPAPTPPPRTDVAPSGGHAPLRPIVTSNPYGGS
ncbi:MAG TPA: serine/threonine-protein kinase [Polyangiaceae bacterium]